MSAPQSRPGWARWLYNHNPFYVISAALMLWGVRNLYGDLIVGQINCWVMMGVLAGYTLLLAAIGISIVRWGKVWEDARSVLLLILFLFLAISVSADDLFVGMESARDGALLMGGGILFSVLVTELVLRATRIRMPLAYRLPLHSFIVLFFVAPWWCSPELHPRSVRELEWTLFAFPLVAAALILSLLPAVTRGPRYVARNGTPWSWPLYPWSAFVMIFVAIFLRTFALCMTFGPTGPIWIPSSSGSQTIAFDTLWGPYFLLPPALAIAVLLLQGARTTKNRQLASRIMTALPCLLLLALPLTSGPVSARFLHQVTERLGSPLWLTTWTLLGIYAWGTLTRVPGAFVGGIVMLCGLSVIGPKTQGVHTMTDPQAVYLVAAAIFIAMAGLRLRQSWAWAAAWGALSIALYGILPETLAANWQMTITFHVTLFGLLAIGLACTDSFAYRLRAVTATGMTLACGVALMSSTAAEVPVVLRVGYVLFMMVLAFSIAAVWKSRWFYYAGSCELLLVGYVGAAQVFHGAIALLGRRAVTAFTWSVGTLGLAVFISAHKAHWLPGNWFNGGQTSASDVTAAPAGADHPPLPGDLDTGN